MIYSKGVHYDGVKTRNIHSQKIQEKIIRADSLELAKNIQIAAQKMRDGAGDIPDLLSILNGAISQECFDKETGENASGASCSALQTLRSENNLDPDKYNKYKRGKSQKTAEEIKRKFKKQKPKKKWKKRSVPEYTGEDKVSHVNAKELSKERSDLQASANKIFSESMEIIKQMEELPLYDSDYISKMDKLRKQLASKKQLMDKFLGQFTNFRTDQNITTVKAKGVLDIANQAGYDSSKRNKTITLQGVKDIQIPDVTREFAALAKDLGKKVEHFSREEIEDLFKKAKKITVSDANGKQVPILTDEEIANIE
jgi:hypothetical protein